MKVTCTPMTDKRTNNDLQNTIQRTKDRATRISLKSDAGGNKDCHKLIGQRGRRDLPYRIIMTSSNKCCSLMLRD
jgi:hypothetical protein